jgi:Flp pilus assembly protein TadG
MVTLEVAVVLPLMITLIIAGATLLAAGHTQARLMDGARAAARELARGDSVGEAFAAVQRVAPGADLTIVRSDEIIEVVARQEVRGPGPILGRLHQVLAATASTRREESW